LADHLAFIKLYSDGRDRMKDLNSCGIAMLAYVMKHIAENRDSIIINTADFLAESGYSNHKNYYSGVISLLNNGYIFRKAGENPNEFFINVGYFFNGKRIKLSAIKDIFNDVVKGK